MELFAAAGMDYVRCLADRGKRVFLDMKYYDIGETVRRAVSLVARSGASFLTVHAVGQVMRAALEGRGDSDLKLLAVTVLTSFDQLDVEEMGYRCPLGELVAKRVGQAMAAGMDGIVGSPLEARAIRRTAGPDAHSGHAGRAFRGLQRRSEARGDAHRSDSRRRGLPRDRTAGDTRRRPGSGSRIHPRRTPGSVGTRRSLPGELRLLRHLFLLMLGIVGPLIPDDTILVLSGLAVHRGQLQLGTTIAVAYAGSLCGISLSYTLGRTGAIYVLERFPPVERWVNRHLPRFRNGSNVTANGLCFSATSLRACAISPRSPRA